MYKWFALLTAALMMLSSGAAAENTFPVYAATARTQQEAHFFDKVDPEWFNRSGEPDYRNGSRSSRYDLFTFPDEAQLTVSAEVIRYEEYSGEYFMIYGDDPENPGGPFPRPSFAAEIGYTAFNQLADAIYHSGDAPALQKTELSGISLAEAQDLVQALLSKLNMTGYELAFALDMSADRIREWGSAYVEESKQFYNVYDRYYDFSTASEKDEGYYLIYSQTLHGLPVGNPDTFENVQAFVTAEGIVSFEMRSGYEIGEVYAAPEKLLTEEEIRKAFEKDNARRIKDQLHDPCFVKATLMYCPMRAPDKKDGMVMAPAWYIDYTFVDGSPCTGWAWYSAVDGRLIADCYS